MIRKETNKKESCVTKVYWIYWNIYSIYLPRFWDVTDIWKLFAFVHLMFCNFRQLNLIVSEFPTELFFQTYDSECIYVQTEKMQYSCRISRNYFSLITIKMNFVQTEWCPDNIVSIRKTLIFESVLLFIHYQMVQLLVC